MKARLSGRCAAHGDRIYPGHEIERYGRAWAHTSCVQRQDTVRELIARAKEHNLWLGVWDCPEGMQSTFSRQEFINRGKDMGVFSDDDCAVLVRAWASILWRDLSD